ncbi:hypothetical protein CAEBREN_22501 [Caenorhabditis brenneri]|uniref:Nuclear Hormone Receptor family n=1 Tax=Caenorhabditis brenneri TaxID=135651 RepID=G0N122_CAEBE|nr:hypothetical protein CAEBREN_22501 [Caenorhabditis brenneri]
MDSSIEGNSTSKKLNSCQVCGQEANGKRHYGAVVCRACAAFFRRSTSFKTSKKCRQNGKCDFLKKGFFTCKCCRLQKCLAVGMTSENFQFDRDGYNRKIPSTIDIFCGKSNLIIFRASPDECEVSKNFIDLQFLVDQAEKLFLQGPESPLQTRTSLQKLALGLHPILEPKNIISPDAKKYGKEESLAQLEYDILTVTKWLCYFDEFQKLSMGLKLQMLQGIWHVWWKLERIAHTALSIRKNIHDSELRNLKNDHLFYSYDKNRIDMSWLSKHTVDELKFFMEIKTEYRLDTLTRSMIQLSPTDTELAFMLGQLCFHYVGKRFQGEILQVSDRFQQILADDLHDYYVNQMKQPYYIKRLQSMMNINNLIQKEVHKNREKTELAIVFDIFHVEVSHPGIFIEI